MKYATAIYDNSIKKSTMKFVDEGQSMRFAQFCQLDMLLEGNKEYLKKFSGHNDSVQLVQKFQEIKKRIKSPMNDIDWWIRRPYSEFQHFVKSFDLSCTKTDRKDFELRRLAIKNGAVLLDVYEGYEIWYPSTYEAAKILGRNYKHSPTHWCICADDNGFYWYGEHNDEDFVFLIRQQTKHDVFDKIALVFNPKALKTHAWNSMFFETWDADDNPDEYNDEDIMHHVYDLLKQHPELKKNQKHSGGFLSRLMQLFSY